MGPLLQLTVTQELSASVAAMDEEDIRPALDTHDYVFWDFQELSDAIEGNAEFLRGLQAAK